MDGINNMYKTAEQIADDVLTKLSKSADEDPMVRYDRDYENWYDELQAAQDKAIGEYPHATGLTAKEEAKRKRVLGIGALTGAGAGGLGGGAIGYHLAKRKGSGAMGRLGRSLKWGLPASWLGMLGGVIGASHLQDKYSPKSPALEAVEKARNLHTNKAMQFYDEYAKDNPPPLEKDYI